MDPRYRSPLNHGVAPAASGEFAPLRIGPLQVWPPVVLAPMAGVTNPPFRTLCRRYGAGLYVSEMITARALVEGNRKTLLLASFGVEETTRSLQLYGSGLDSTYVPRVQSDEVGGIYSLPYGYSGALLKTDDAGATARCQSARVFPVDRTDPLGPLGVGSRDPHRRTVACRLQRRDKQSCISR